MSSPQKMLSKRDIRKYPQCVVEGSTPATYGIPPPNPSFQTKGQRSMLSNTNEPEFIDNDFGGTYDRKGIIKTREKNTVTYRGRFLDADLDILKWATNLPNGVGTPDESRTWVDSYKKFVLSTDSSVSIEKFIKEKGGTVQRSKVGEANVIELMLKTSAQAGGEGSSGGFILPEFNYCREGILTSGLITSMLGTTKFNEILNYMENYSQIRDKIKVDSNFHDKVIEEMNSKFSKEYSETNTLDGMKGIIDEDSWVLIRKSNTEDIIRVSAESNDKEKCKNIVNTTLESVKECYDKVR